MSIGLDWILTAAVALIGTLIGVIWHSNVKSVQDVSERLGKDIGCVAEQLQKSLEKCGAESARQFSAVWQHINSQREDIVVLKESRGSLATEIENIKKRLDDIPDHRALNNEFRDFEARFERRLDAVGKQIQEIVLGLIGNKGNQ
jgi:predicted  nucleic acid-binding Zn-ribbon protein